MDLGVKHKYSSMCVSDAICGLPQEVKFQIHILDQISNYAQSKFIFWVRTICLSQYKCLQVLWDEVTGIGCFFMVVLVSIYHEYNLHHNIG